MSLGREVRVAFELTLEDYRALQRQLCAPINRLPWYVHALVALATAAGSVLAIVAFSSPLGFLLGLCFGIAMVAVVTKGAMARNKGLLDPMPNGSVLCAYDFSFSQQGVAIRTPHWDSNSRWSGVTGLAETQTHLFLMIDRAAAYTLPKRAFASAEELAVLRGLVDGNVTAQRS